MILIKNLTKSYRRQIKNKGIKYEKIIAIDNLNLTIKKGEIFGFIGPNGAGKTTTLKILSTLIIPDHGSVTIDGYDLIKEPDLIKRNIGLLTGEFVRSLYWRLTVKQNLKFFANLKEIKDSDNKINELIHLFRLEEQKNEQVMKLSTGMKHKLALAVGLLHDPKVLFLDEPLTGIDPVTAYEIKGLIKNKFTDKTIIWASHNLYEVEEMCHKIALVNNGKIILEGDPNSLKNNYWDHFKVLITVNNVKPFSSINGAMINNNVVQINTNNINDIIKKIHYLINNNDIEIIEIRTLKPSLEDIFMSMIKNVS